MKKQLSIAALLLAAIGNSFAGNADFILVNKTGYAINEVYISPAQKNNWGSDRLGQNQFLNGQSRTFRFGDTRNCKQDIKVIFTDGDDIEWEDFNLCELNKITLKYNKKTNEVSADYE